MTAAQQYAEAAFARDPAWDGSTPPALYTNEELVDCLLQVYARSCAYQTRSLHDRWVELHAELMHRLPAYPRAN